MRGVFAVAMTLLAAGAWADEVLLHGGGRITGIIALESPESVEVEVGAGRIAVPRALVLDVRRSDSALSEYQRRARALSADDVPGWLELGAWARKAELTTQSREAYERVLASEPGNAAAHRALGHTQVGDEWLSHEQAMRARGYVQVDGEWLTAEERDARLAEREAARRERTEQEAARLALAEAEARAREAEARARLAEAEASQVEEEMDGFWHGGVFVPRHVVVVPVPITPRCCSQDHAPGQCPRKRGHSSVQPKPTPEHRRAIESMPRGTSAVKDRARRRDADRARPRDTGEDAPAPSSKTP